MPLRMVRDGFSKVVTFQLRDRSKGYVFQKRGMKNMTAFRCSKLALLNDSEKPVCSVAGTEDFFFFF